MKLDAGKIQQIRDQGCCLLQAAVTSDLIDRTRRELDTILTAQGKGVLVSDGIPYGIRNLLAVWPAAGRFVEDSRLTVPVMQLLGEPACLVRALFFDKPPGKAWTLPWHRDRTIAVQQHVPDAEGLGFSNPTMKAGIAHYTAPPSLLQQMLTVRVSLDPMHEANGPLVVMEGSHRSVGAQDLDLEKSSESGTMATVHCQAGDAFLMRPLLAHSSLMPQADCTSRRRVVHLEFCSRQLPGSLQWAWCTHLS